MEHDVTASRQRCYHCGAEAFSYECGQRQRRVLREAIQHIALACASNRTHVASGNDRDDAFCLERVLASLSASRRHRDCERIARPEPGRYWWITEDGEVRGVAMQSPLTFRAAVTPVPLACAAIQSFDSDFLSRARLLERMTEMRDALVELNGRVIRHERSIEETFDRAWRMLRMRRVLIEEGDGYVVLPRNRELVSYYANSIAHLLGPFEEAVRSRDRLPATEVARV